MKTAAEKLRDAQISHSIAINRYGNGLARRIVELLNSVDDDLMSTIAARLASTQRLTTLLEELRTLNSTVYSRVADGLEVELIELADTEINFQTRALQAALPSILQASVPPTVMLRSIVLERPITGTLLKPWVKGLEDARLQRVEQALRIGLVESETIDQIVRRIRGTRAQRYEDGILAISRRSAQALVRTSVTHVTTQAREETYAANDDLIKGVKWISTLDGRTSVVCAARDGQIYEVGKGPRPPGHPGGCRSTTIPILKSWREIGIDADEATPAIRASMDGAVPADRTFGQFLKDKPASFQNDVLGKSKAEAFRKGLPLDRFIDTTGREYTLDELRRRNPDFFD